jgi:hypothetical protein
MGLRLSCHPASRRNGSSQSFGAQGGKSNPATGNLAMQQVLG